MPHAEDPTQLDTESEVVADETNGNGGINGVNGFEDPRGMYLGTAELKTESTGGSKTLFAIENKGVDLLIDQLVVTGSQGGEDGRGYGYFGWKGENAYATEWVAPKIGVGAGSAYSRETVVYQFEPDTRPLWEFKDDLYVALAPDSSSGTDGYKMFAWVRAIRADADHGGMSSSRL